MEKLIDLQDLKKSFSNHQVLKGVTFEVFSGQIVGLIGPSGAGKSTLIKTLLGMEKADGGRALVLSTQMPNLKILSEIGYMAQSDALYESLSGRENLEFFGKMKGIGKEQLKNEIVHFAELVELTNFLENPVSSYSGGMKRRLSLAIALLGEPKLLILDEPTVGIDPSLRRKIWEELDILRKNNCAILVTTHVMDEAELTDKVAFLLKGNIIAFNTPEGLKSDYGVDTIEDAFLKAEGVL